jgi:hypothetical protein
MKCAPNYGSTEQSEGKKTEAFSLTTSFALYDRLAEKDPFSLIN